MARGALLAVFAAMGFALAAGLAFAASRTTRPGVPVPSRPDWQTPALALASGIAAAFAPTGGTGAHLGAALLGTGLVLLASRSGEISLIVPILLVAAASPTENALIAAAAAGVLSAVSLGGQKSQTLRALGGGLVANGVLRLDRGSAWVQLAIGVGAVVLVALVGARGQGGWRVARRLGLAVAALAAVSAGLGVLTALQARSHLLTGIRLAKQGLTSAERGQETDATARLRAASAQFAAGETNLTPWWVEPAMTIPIVDDNLHALEVLARVGGHLTASAAKAAAVANPDTIQIGDGRIPLDRLSTLEQPLADAESALARADHDISAAGSPWLIPPVRSRLTDLRAKVDKADNESTTALLGARLGPIMLGSQGSRRYFLAIVTPAEARGVGGMIGAYGEIVASHGRVHLDKLGRVGDLDAIAKYRGVHANGPPDFLARYGQDLAHGLWQNVAESPDFPTVAAVIRELYPQCGGTAVDGVISIDPIGLAAVMRLVGPIRVPDWPEVLTADTVAPVLLHDEYVRLAGTERIDFLETVARAVVQRLTTGYLSNLRQLGRVLGDAVRSKHLMMDVPDAAEHDLLTRFGATGAMRPIRGDSLAVITQNAGGNKLDWYLRRSVEYQVFVAPGSKHLVGTVTIVLRNLAPASGEPAYVLGNIVDRTLPLGTNRLLLSVYTPWGLDWASRNAQRVTMQSQLELDRHVYSMVVTIPPGGETTVTLQLSGQLGTAEYALDAWEQPSVTADDWRFTLIPAAGWRARPAVGPAADSGRLEHDQTLRYALDRMTG